MVWCGRGFAGVEWKILTCCKTKMWSKPKKLKRARAHTVQPTGHFVAGVDVAALGRALEHFEGRGDPDALPAAQGQQDLPGFLLLLRGCGKVRGNPECVWGDRGICVCACMRIHACSSVFKCIQVCSGVFGCAQGCSSVFKQCRNESNKRNGHTKKT